MRFTLIDIGSNSVKCNLYEQKGALRPLLSQSRTVGLIRYVAQGCLSDSGLKALLDVLSEYLSLSNEMGCEAVYAVATAALRGLDNREQVLCAIRDVGCHVRIISGQEEAMLGYRAAMATTEMPKKGILVDLGGASTELSAYEDGRLVQFVSLPMGCLRLYRDHVSHVLPTEKERNAIRDRVKELLAPLPFLKEYGTHLTLIGGTAKTIGRLIAAEDGIDYENGMRVGRDRLRALKKAYHNPSRERIGRLVDLAPDRLHTLVPGLVAYHTLAKACDAADLTLSFAGIRDGLAYDIVNGRWKEDVM